MNPETPPASLRRGLLFWALATGAGLLANRGLPAASLLFYGLLLGAPLLEIRPAAYPRLFGLRRRGFSLALGLAALAAGALYAAAFLLAKVWLRGLFLHPGPMETASFLGGKLLLLAPGALAEEVFFRGYLQETVFAARWGDRRMGPLSYRNLAAAGLFALSHVIAGLSFRPLHTFPGGLLLGWLVERAGGHLWPAVFLHLFANLLSAWAATLLRLNLPSGGGLALLFSSKGWGAL